MIYVSFDIGNCIYLITAVIWYFSKRWIIKPFDPGKFKFSAIWRLQYLSKAWKLVKKLKNKYNPSPAPLTHLGNKVHTDGDKANLLATMFAKISTTDNLPDSNRELRLSEEIKLEYADPVPDNTQPINLPFSMDELDSVLTRIKATTTAAGKDEITYALLKHLP